MNEPDRHIDCLAPVRIRVFFGANAMGNTAVCHAVEHRPDLNYLLANFPAHETHCFIWSAAIEHDDAHVLIVQGGRAVEFCGHGLLACAFWWLQRFGKLPTLHTDKARFRTLIDGDRVLFGVAPFSLTHTHADCARDWFDTAPSEVLLGDARNSYALCLWPRGIDIALIKNRPETIALQPRAIVMTQSDEATSKRELFSPLKFDMRYLAPQYGNAEDSATGSAAAVALSFWRERWQCARGDRFEITQRSPGGGEIIGKADSDVIWIGGRTDFVPSPGGRGETAVR